VQHLGVAERRARLARRHRLADEARADDDVVDIARSVVVLHATDPATVVLSALARMQRPDPKAVTEALHVERTLVRMLAMRRTLFTVPVDDAPLVHAAASRAVATAERKRFLTRLDDAGVSSDPARWLRAREQEVLRLLAEHGEMSAAELSALSPVLGRQIVIGEGTSHPGKTGVGSRVLLLLAADGKVVRSRTTGAWTSTRHRWDLLERWLGGPLTEVPVTEARAALAARWLARFGPGTMADLKWWTGWTMTDTRAAVASLATEPVDLDGAEGVVLLGDTEPTPPAEPWVAFLPSLDPTAMGWQRRDWYLGDHKAQVFDRTGNAGATVWADGRIVGGWAQRASGEVVWRLLEPLGREQADAVADAAGRLEVVLGEARVVPRFPAPLDRELRA
jgi:Winged helix DNA-binding domain